MKSSLLIRLIVGLVITGSATAQNEEKNGVGSPFGNSPGALPSSVALSVLKDGNYAITISGIAEATPEGRKLDAPEPNPGFHQTGYDGELSRSGVLDYHVDHDKRTLELILSRGLDKNGISKAVDVLAVLRKDVPCWDELVARDVKKSEKFREDFFLVQSLRKLTSRFDGAPILSGDRSWSAPFEIGSGHATVTLSIIRMAAPVGRDPRYMIRFLDGESRPIWTDDTTVKGQIAVEISKRESTGGQEIILHCGSREGQSLYRIAPNDKASVEPSEVPVDDSRPTPRQPPESPLPAKPGSAPQ